MRKAGTLGYAGGASRIKNEGQILSGINMAFTGFGRGRLDKFVKHQMLGFMVFCRRDFAQERAKESLYRRQIGPNVADDNGMDLGALHGLQCRWIKQVMIHDKQGLCAGVFELEVEF